jgi:hypothetical protein
MSNPNDECKVHLVEPDFGAPYWRKFAFCSDGQVVSGHGLTAEDAEWHCAHTLKEREDYLALPDIERLTILVQGDLLDTDKKEAIRIIAKLIINHEKSKL